MIRRLVITLVVLAGLGAVGNVWLGNVAEHKAADQIKVSLKLSTTPVVKFDAFPILLRLLQGRLPHATVDARDLKVKGLGVELFHLEIDDLRLSLADMTSSHGRLRVGGGEAFGEVTQQAANAYLKREQQNVTVTFDDSTVRVHTKVTYGGIPHDVRATGQLKLDGNDLIFVPLQVTVDGEPPPRAIVERARRDASFRAPLPALPGGVRPKRVTVSDGVARLEVTFGATTLDLNSL